jgi:hypothetical protein
LGRADVTETLPNGGSALIVGGVTRARLRLALAVTALALSSATAGQPARKPPLPLEVDFSVPAEGEADVRLDAHIRIQFSRDAEPSSLADRVRLAYSREESTERGEAQPPALSFTTRYSDGTRVLEIVPAQPLERFRQVRLDLLEGIVGTDGSVLKPWSLRFRTGGS